MPPKRKKSKKTAKATPRQQSKNIEAKAIHLKHVKNWLLANLDYIAAASTAIVFVAHLFATDEFFIGSGTDMVSNEIPLHLYAAKWLKQGVLPLWNPSILGGIPFQAGVHGYLYPVWWTSIVFPAGFDLKLGVLIHLILAATGMVWFMRGRVKSQLATYVAAIIFTLSGFTIMHLFAGHRVMVATAAYLPWIVGALDRAIRGTPRQLMQAGLLTGLMLLAGHYHVVFIGMGGIALFTLLERIVGEPLTTPDLSTRLRDTGKAVTAWFIAFAIGALVSAVQLIPMLGTVEHSHRTGGDAAFSASFSSAPINLLTYCWPNFFGNKIDVPFVGDWAYWEALGYLGIAPLVLIVVGLFILPVRRFLPALIVVFFGLLLSLGAHTPFFDLYLKIVPGAGLFRSPGRFCLLATLFGALVAGQSIDLWLEGRLSSTRRRLCVLGAWLLPIFLIGAAVILASTNLTEFKEWITPYLDKKRVVSLGNNGWTLLLELVQSDSLAAAGLSTITAVAITFGIIKNRFANIAGTAIAVLLVLDLYYYDQPFLRTAKLENFVLPAQVTELIKSENGLDYRFIAPPSTRWHDYGAADEISTPGGYDSFIDGRYARYNNRSRGRSLDFFFGYEKNRRGSRLLRHLAPKLVFTKSPLKNGRNRSLRGYDWVQQFKRLDQTFVYRAEDPVPRVTLVHRYRIIEDEVDTYKEMERNDFDIRDLVLLEETLPEGFPAPASRSLNAKEKATITLIEPNRVTIDVEAAADAILVMSDTLHPGWSATVDGTKVPMVHANRVMRALPVAAGKHSVEMNYLPNSVIVGAFVSIFSLLGLGGVFWLFRRRRETSGDRG
jgi:Bacterial membrane protein YfhO